MKKILVLGLCCGVTAAFAAPASLSSQKAVDRDLSAHKAAQPSRTALVDQPVSVKAETDVVSAFAGNTAAVEVLSPVQHLIHEMKLRGDVVPADLYLLAQQEAGYRPMEHEGSSRQGGETIATATAIPSLPYSDSGTTDGYVNDYDEVCPYTGSTSPDVVYAYTPAGNQVINIDLCLSSYDTKLYVYENAHTPGAPYACNDDFHFAAPCYAYSSKIEFLNVTGGNTYYIVVDGYGGSSGAYVLDVTAVDDCPPVDCVGTPEVEPNDGPNGDPIAYGSVDCGETICGDFWADGGTRDTDWYELLLIEDSIVSIDLSAGPYDGLIFLIAGDAATILYTGDAGSYCTAEQIVSDCLPAGTYYVWAGPAVFEGVPNPEDYALTVSCEPCTYTSPCEDAVEMVCGSTYEGDTSDDLNYVGNAAPDNFFFIDNTVPGNIVTFSLCGGATWDTYLRLYDNCPTDPGAVQLAFNDDFCGLQSEITYTLDVATYWLVVEGFSSGSGAYTLTVSCTTVGPCDEYVPTAITLPYSGTGTNVGAPNVWGGTAGDVGYTFTITEDVSLTFESCLPGTDYDTDSYLLLGDPCDGGTEILYNDGDSGCEYASWASGWTIDCGVLAPGTYTLIVSGFSASEGNFEFSLTTGDCVCEPIDCVGVAEVEPNDGPNGDPIAYDSIDCGVTVCGTTFTTGDTLRDTDWFELVLFEDSELVIDLEVEEFNGLLFLIAADAATILYTADNGGYCEDEQIVTDCLLAGTYYVWVGHNGFTGVDTPANYGLTVSCTPCEWVSPYTACQLPDGDADPWTAATSEVDVQGTNYLRAEQFGAGGTITAIDFRGLPLFLDGSWAGCTEDPMDFVITFYGLDLVPVATFTPSLTGVPSIVYAGLYPSFDYYYELDTPVVLTEGFVSIQGAGSNSCWFLWMSSVVDGADGTSLLSTDGAAWVADAFDLNYCLTVEQTCDAPTNLVISVTGGHASLNWDAVPGATSYTVFYALDGYGSYAPLGNTVGTSFTDVGATAAGRRNYKVVANCGAAE
jgi:hypothetical protein